MMRIVRDLEELRLHESPAVLAIGFFDGVHKGHQAVIKTAIELAARQLAQSWLLTFSPHPLKIISPANAPPLLTSTPHKLRLFDQLGLDGVIVQEFNQQLRETEPEAFLHMLCRAMPHLRHIVVGENWRFGRNQSGSADTLDHLARELNLKASRVPPLEWQGGPVSSTRVREAVRAGALKDAAMMLGRPFSIWGNVVHGDKVGRALGYPTANVDPHNEVHPPDGIYAAIAKIGDASYHAAVYVGHRPTMNDGKGPWVVEVYLLDTSLDLYGKEMEVLFVEKIREDRRFESRDQLISQIEEDVATVRSVLSAAGRESFL